MDVDQANLRADTSWVASYATFTGIANMRSIRSKRGSWRHAHAEIRQRGLWTGPGAEGAVARNLAEREDAVGDLVDY